MLELTRFFIADPLGIFLVVFIAVSISMAKMYLKKVIAVSANEAVDTESE